MGVVMKNFDIPCYYIIGETGEKVAVIIDIEDFEALLEGASVFSQLVEATQSAAEDEKKSNKKKATAPAAKNKKVSVKTTKKSVVKKAASKKTASKKTVAKKK